MPIMSIMLIIAITVAAAIAVTTTVSLVAAPIFGFTLNDSTSINPTRLASLLENGNISEFNNERKQIKQQIVFDSIDLSNKDLSGVNLQSLVMLHSRLSDTNLENSSLIDVQISGDLSNINLRNASLSNASLYNADLTNANLIFADLSNAILTDADLTDADLSGSTLTNANVSSSTLTNADLSNSTLGDAILFNADLTNANLRDSNLTNTVLSDTTLSGSIFNCKSLRTADLIGNTNQIHIVDLNNKEVSSCQ